MKVIDFSEKLQGAMDITELPNDHNFREKLSLHNQAEITSKIGEFMIVPTSCIIHGFYVPPNCKIGRSLTNEDSFYDSFRQGLEVNGIFVNVVRLKEICKSFASDPPVWFKEGIKKSVNSPGRVGKIKWNEFGKNVCDKNIWNDPDVQGWILCEKYDMTLYLIEKQNVYGMEKYLTQIIDKESYTTYNGALFLTGKAKITVVNFGSGFYEPMLNILGVMLIGRFGNFKNLLNKRKTSDEKCNEKITKRSNSFNNKEKLVVIEIINDLVDTIKSGGLDKFKDLTNRCLEVDRNILNKIVQDPRNILNNTNLVVLACKYNKLDILQYILNENHTLYDFPSTNKELACQYKYDAFYYATKNMNIDLVNTLYDHFIDELHWSGKHQNKNIIQTIKEINAILIKTWINCVSAITENLQMLIDLHCFIEISHFQTELYSELNKIEYNNTDTTDIRLAETKTVVEILLTLLRIYRKYNSKDIRLPSNEPDTEIRWRILFADRTSIYLKSIHECMYDVYYRKLDTNVCLLILDNLHYLQQRLELPCSEYKKIESAIYYFINRTYEEWRLILPANRKKTKVEYLIDIFYSTQKCKATAIYDETKALLGPVLYLSRKDFSDALRHFENVLIKTDIENSVRKKGKKLATEEINRLSLLPLMRDNFSLRKILIYLQTLSTVDFDNDKVYNVLMIERIIQVVGELFKTANESVHLDSLTKALVELVIPSEIIENFKEMRDFLSHSNDGRLLRRIYVLNKESHYFKEVLKDLNELTERIYEVLNFYNPLIDKWIIEKGLSVISFRKGQISVDKLHILKFQLYKLPPVKFPKTVIAYENKLMAEHNISRQLLREINSLNNNEDQLRAVYTCIEQHLIQLITQKLHKIETAIREKLQYIDKRYFSKRDQCLKEWEFVIKLFEYIITVAGFLDNHPYEIQQNSYSNMLENIKNRISHRSVMVDAYNLLAIIEIHASAYIFKSKSNPYNSTTIINQKYEFTGIKSLKATLDKHYRFIIDEELTYVLDDLKKNLW